MVPPIFAAAVAATSHPRDVRHTAPLLTAGTRAPTPFGLLLRSVIPPTRTARLSPARALLEPIFGVLLSLMAFICPHCSRISPACQEFTPRAPSHAGRAEIRQSHNARRSRPAVHSVPRRPADRNRRPSEWLHRFHPERQNTRRESAGCLLDVCYSVFAPNRGDADVTLSSTALGAVQKAGTLYRQVVATALALTTLMASSCAPFSTTSILMVCVPVASSVLSRTVNGLFCTAASVASMVYSFTRISST